MIKEMTREEAINWQEAFKRIYPLAAEACDMAIAALQEMEYEKWKYTVNEKPKSTKHVIVAFDFSDISHYGYYLEPKDKWYTDWTCNNETPVPKVWREMPEIPDDIKCDTSCG